jgi:P pilus assembly chaperone PapD
VLDLKGDTFPRYEISSSSSAITVIFGEQSSAASNAAVSAELPETSDIQSFLIVERPDITITGDLGSAGITMKNSSASAVLVSSSVSKVVASPSTDQSAEQPSKDILVSPCRFELAPGSARTISVVLAGTRQDTEQIYRVRLTPAAGTIVGQTESVLVLVPPLNGIPKLTWRTTDNGLVLSNEGNASIELASGTFCPRALSLCQSIPNRRLLPGESWELALVESGQLDFWTRKGDASQERMSILVEHHG